MKGFPISVIVICTRGIHTGRVGVVGSAINSGPTVYLTSGGTQARIQLYKPGQTKELDTEIVVANAEDWECA